MEEPKRVDDDARATASAATGKAFDAAADAADANDARSVDERLAARRDASRLARGRPRASKHRRRAVHERAQRRAGARRFARGDG